MISPGFVKYCHVCFNMQTEKLQTANENLPKRTFKDFILYANFHNTTVCK